MVSEPEGKAWLLANDFAVPQGKVTSGQNLGAVASKLGYPLALKMVSPYLPHKTEAGAVVLNLSDAASAIQASIKMQADVVSYNPQAATNQFLLEAMSPKPLAELIVTLRRDPQFGIALVLGSGGILVELVGDAVTLLLPLSPQDINRAIKKLRVIGLLNGFRGGPQVDLEKISLQIHRLCIAYTKHQDEIAEIEINPLFIYSDQVCAVDVLVHKFN
jgi:succinyl-CoA synthetase beta subunit